MKKTKVIIPALGILLLSTAASVTGTVAWFSSNSSVSATGMNIKAKTDESLVIDKDHAVAADITVSFDDVEVEALTPITYDGGNYKYVSNGAIVDPSTGKAQTGKELSFAQVQSASAAGLYFYHDFVVYIAAAGVAIEDAELLATVTFESPALTQKAATIDFKVFPDLNSDLSTQAASLTRDNTVNASMTATELTEVSLKTGVDFPLNTENKSVAVLMRVYFDGALEEGTTGKTYVRSEAVDLTDLGISVAFTLGA